MQQAGTFYWHDYETFGISPAQDRPVQFAGIRTDIDLNIISTPLVVYCKLAADSLPHPDSCLITGITPQIAEQKGICEAEFIRLIHQQLAQPNTCSLGYNTLRFDDEVTRNCLYRNFYDPYAREWQYHNSRWDIIDVARAAKALRPEGINWPVNSDMSSSDLGKPSFKLEHLTKANGIDHGNAHEALADVYATIAIAKLIKSVQPKLYRFLWQHRIKAEVLKLLDLGSLKPVVHISGKYSTLKNCLAIVLPICGHPTNNNGIIAYDLSVDPEAMLSLSVEEIQQRIFTATDNLPEGIERIPLKTIHVNKCPVLAPISVIRTEDEQRLKLDLAVCYANRDKIKSATGLAKKLAAVFSGSINSEYGFDPDLALYSGGFFPDADKQKFALIRNTQPSDLTKLTKKFSDPRLPEMLFRYRARNYPETLSIEETEHWKEFCRDKLTGVCSSPYLTFEDYFARLKQLKIASDANIEIINALEDYAAEKMQWLGIR